MNKLSLRTASQGPRLLLIWLFTKLSQPVVRPIVGLLTVKKVLPFEVLGIESLFTCYLFDLSTIFYTYFQWTEDGQYFQIQYLTLDT